MNSKTADRVATVVLVAIATIIVCILVGLFAYILFNGLRYVSLDFLTSPSSNVRAGGGVRDQLFNSLYILVITMIISLPLGIGGGIFMAEYARPGKVTDIIRSCIEVLSSLPSIVIGMFGLLMFVNLTGWGYTILGELWRLPFLIFLF